MATPGAVWKDKEWGKCGFWGVLPVFDFPQQFLTSPCEQELCFLLPHSPPHCREGLVRPGSTRPEQLGVLGRARGKSEETPQQEEGAETKTLLDENPPQAYL